MPEKTLTGGTTIHGDGAGQSALRPVVGIFLFALLVRGLYLYESSDNPTFYAPIVDSLTYDQMARDLINGKGLTHEFFWQPLFYPLFLSLVYWLSNSSLITVKIIQMVLGGLTSVLTFKLGDKIFARATGIVAGVVTAVYMPLVFFEGELLAVGWAAFWSVALVLLLTVAMKSPSVPQCVTWGLCGALAVVTRPVFVPFFAAGCLWLLITWIRSRTRTRTIIARAASVAIGFFIVAGPVAVVSYTVMSKVMILPYSGSVNMYVGNNPDYKETVNIRPGLGWSKLMKLPEKHGFKKWDEKQEFFKNRTAEYIATNPGGFLKGLAHKSLQFVSSRELPRNVDVYVFRKWSWILKAAVWKADGFGFPFGALLPLAVVGAVFFRRTIPTPVWLFFVFYPASVILVFVTSRYRTPIIPVMSVLAAAGVVTVWRFLRTRRWKEMAVVGGVVLAVGTAESAFGRFSAEQIDFEPELYYGLGDSFDKRGRTQEGIDAYLKAVSLRPQYVEAHHNLGLLLVKQQRLDEAITHYRSALEADPNNAGPHEDLGMALFRQGKTEEAIEHYQKAIQIEPEKASVYDNLGTAYFSLRKAPEALEHYSRAVELDPDDPVARNNLGNVFALQGQLDKAVEQYERSLELKPGDPETLNNLANALAHLGRFDEAVARYTEALQVAPDDPGIYCNLGLCLQRQGRPDEAIQAFSKALEIDPQRQQALQALKKLAAEKGSGP
jgi:tetratricopeptide (TPR) repeat protein